MMLSNAFSWRNVPYYDLYFILFKFADFVYFTLI